MTIAHHECCRRATRATWSRRRALVTLGGIPLLALAAPAWSLAPGEAAPSCVVRAPDGSRSFDVAERRGKLQYLDFWASWCPPCRESFPFMNELQHDLAPRGLSILALSVDKNPDDARRFLERFPPQFPVALDSTWICASAYLLPGMPTTFIVDSTGVVRALHIGFRGSDEAHIRAELEHLLGELK